MKPSRYLIWWLIFLMIVVPMGITAAVVARAMLDRKPPRLEIRGVPSAPAFRHGEFFSGLWTMTFVRDCPGWAQRTVSAGPDSGVEQALPAEHVRGGSRVPPKTPFAEWKVPISGFPISEYLPPGPAYYELSVVFQCNWLQRLFPALGIKIDYPVIEFEVLPADPADSPR